MDTKQDPYISCRQENTGSKLFDIGLNLISLDMSHQAGETNAKVNKWEYTKLKSFLAQQRKVSISLDFPGGSDGKVSAYNTGDPSSIPGLRRSPEEENGNPLWYSYLENPMDGETWQASVNGVTEARVRHDLVTKPPSPLSSR